MTGGTAGAREEVLVPSAAGVDAFIEPYVLHTRAEYFLGTRVRRSRQESSRTTKIEAFNMYPNECVLLDYLYYTRLKRDERSRNADLGSNKERKTNHLKKRATQGSYKKKIASRLPIERF
jgi:hypothetical protein